METDTDRAAGIWQAPECPFAIEYSKRVLDDIRLAVTDAFFSLPRGGVEIGGILVGKHLPGRVIIDGHVPLDCEHAFGPSFTLSPNDHIKLERLLGDAARDSGSDAVGWYHSHTRSEIFFSDSDIEVHNRFFPKLWQVGLVVRPRTLGPAGAGFFFRENDGSIHGQKSYAEFMLENLPTRPAPASDDAAPASDTWAPVGVDEPRDGTAVEPYARVVETEPDELRDVRNQFTRPDRSPDRTSEVRDAALDVRKPVEVRAPTFTVDAPVSRAWMASVGIIAGFALGAVGFATRDRWLPQMERMFEKTPQASRPAAESAHVIPLTPGATVDFTAKDSEGQLLLRWNRASPLILDSTGGLLMIADGNSPPQAIGLDSLHLKAGSFTYARQTGRVDVTLTVHLAGGQDLKEIATFLGKDPPTASAPPPQSTPPQATHTRPPARVEKQGVGYRKPGRSPQELREELERELLRRRLSNQAPDAVKK